MPSIPSSATQQFEMAPLQEGLQVVSAASRNARTCWEVQPYGTFLTYSSRLGLLDCNVAVAVAVAALCAANANPCAAPPPPTGGGAGDAAQLGT